MPKNVLTSCDCIEQVNAKLAPKNQQLPIGFGMPATHKVGAKVVAIARLFFKTVKRDAGGRGRSLIVSATYCPFCGIKAAP